MTAEADILKQLRETYFASAEKRLFDISEALTGLESDLGDLEILRELRRHFHGFAGSGATYGFPEITTLGRKGESRCDEILERAGTTEAQDIGLWRECVSGISAELGREEEGFDEAPEIEERYLFHSDRTGLQLQMEMLEKRPDDVDLIGDWEEFEEQLTIETYGAILIDDRDRASNVRRIARMRENSMLQYKTPLLVVSEAVHDYSHQLRMELAQLGVDQIISSDSTLTDLRKESARIRGSRRSHRGVVLLVDSDTHHFEELEEILARREIITLHAKDHSELAQCWFTRPPDLLLYRQDTVDAQDARFFQTLKGSAVLKTVDIVLLVSDYAISKRTAIFDQGVDDFLELPLLESEVMGRLLPRLELKRGIRTRGRDHDAGAAGGSTETKSPSSATGTTKGEGTEGLRVLLADDDPPIRGLLAFHLEKAGWDVCAVEDGRQAVEELAKSTFDLAVLDVNMPIMSGFDVLDWLASHAQRRPAKVVMLTAMSYEASVQRAFELGVDEFLSKPFDPLVAVTRIKRLFA